MKKLILLTALVGVSLYGGGTASKLKEGAEQEKKHEKEQQKLLLNKGLFGAAMHDDVEKVRYYLALGADVNAPNLTYFNGKLASPGSTVLMTAAGCGKAKAVRALLHAKANVNAVNDKGDTALTEAAFQKDPGVVEALIAAKANVTAQNKRGLTALMSADRPDVVRLLLNAKANIHAESNKGNTALILAVLNHKFDAVPTLLEAGAKINVQNLKGDTALILAAYAGKPKLVQVLLDGGADTTITSQGKTALEWARERAQEAQDNMEYTTDFVRVVSLLKAAEKRRAEQQGQLPEREKKINEENQKLLNRNLLFAASFGFIDDVYKSLAAGADPNAKDPNGLTVLMRLVDTTDSSDRRVDVMRRLLAAKADIDAVINNGDTALILAAYAGKPKLVQVLLDAGADTTITSQAKTALEWARERAQEAQNNRKDAADFVRVVSLLEAAENRRAEKQKQAAPMPEEQPAPVGEQGPPEGFALPESSPPSYEEAVRDLAAPPSYDVPSAS